MRRLAGLAVVSVLALTSCGDGGGSASKAVSSSDFGEGWPLTVDKGTLRCEGSDGVGFVTIEVGGTTYALNGAAKGQGMGEDIEVIWAPNPDIDGARKDLGVLISEGLGLCS